MQVSNSKLSRKGYVSKPLLFNFAIENAVGKVQDNLERLKLNGKHHLLLV
jgi:hypothetical protein